MGELFWKCISAKDFKSADALFQKKLNDIENLSDKDKSKILDLREQEMKIIDMKIYQTDENT